VCEREREREREREKERERILLSLKKGNPSFVATWMELKGIVLTIIRQRKGGMLDSVT
jgi:hypothetical protein